MASFYGDGLNIYQTVQNWKPQIAASVTVQREPKGLIY